MSTRTHHLAELAVFTAVAFLFSYIESLFPLPVPFPGIKLGLANLVILIILYRNGLRAAFGVSMVRNVLNALTFGSLFGLFYSLAGSILSLLVMGILYTPPLCSKNGKCASRTPLMSKKHPQLSLTSVSAVGGIIHNIGQFIVAICLVGYSAILHYLPFLYFAGLIAGVLIGILSQLCLDRLPRLINSKN